MLQILKKLAEIPSASGREKKLTDYIAEFAAPYADEVYTDAIGNLIVRVKKEGAKKLMLAAHIDEIGFMATGVTDKGFVRIAPIGGIGVAASAYTIFVFENGVKGVLVPDKSAGVGDWRPDKAVIDIGAKDKKDAEKKVKLGDTAVMQPGFTRLMNNRWCGHPLDDKIGAAIMLKALVETPRDEYKNDTYYVFTVQEEVGCRGSKTAAFAIAPDVGIAFDVTRTGDEYGTSPMEVKLGGGAAIKIKDSSVICDAELVERLKELADKNNVKYQLEILLAGGTDTSSMQMAGSGAKAGCISIPTRNIHTGQEMFEMSDAAACIALTEAVVKSDI